MMALLPLLVMLSALAAQMIATGDSRAVVPLLLGTVCALIQAAIRGKKWDILSKELYASVATSLPSLSIYLLAGPLISSWLAAGSLQAIILLGLKLVNPRAFLLCAFLLPFVAGVLMGTGIPAVATVGVAMASVGHALGFPDWMTAGAVAAGAYAGAAVSPMSQPVTLTPAVVGSEYREHLKGCWRAIAVPMAAACVLYLAMGFRGASAVSVSSDLVEKLGSMYHLGIWSLVPPVVMVTLIIKGKPALPSFAVSIALSVLLAVTVEGVPLASVPAVLTDGYRYSGGDQALRLLLNRGGLLSMMSVALLVLLGLAFTGAIRSAGLIEGFFARCLEPVRSPLALRAVCVLCGLLALAVTSTSILSILILAPVFAPIYKRRGLSITELGVTLDLATCCATAFFPWSLNGAYLIEMMKLNVSAADYSGLLYMPCCLTALLSPLWMAIRPLPKGETMARDKG